MRTYRKLLIYEGGEEAIQSLSSLFLCLKVLA